MNDPKCPALEYGRLTACRFCKFTGGGPSGLCVKMLARWQANEAKKRKTAEEGGDK